MKQQTYNGVRKTLRKHFESRSNVRIKLIKERDSLTKRLDEINSRITGVEADMSRLEATLREYENL